MGEATHKITIVAPLPRGGVTSIKDGDEVEVTDHEGKSVKLKVGEAYETSDSDAAAWVAEKAAIAVGNDKVRIETEYEGGDPGLREGLEQEHGRALSEAEKGALVNPEGPPPEPAASTKKSSS